MSYKGDQTACRLETVASVTRNKALIPLWGLFFLIVEYYSSVWMHQNFCLCSCLWTFVPVCTLMNKHSRTSFFMHIGFFASWGRRTRGGIMTQMLRIGKPLSETTWQQFRRYHCAPQQSQSRVLPVLHPHQPWAGAACLWGVFLVACDPLQHYTMCVGYLVWWYFDSLRTSNSEHLFTAYLPHSISFGDVSDPISYPLVTHVVICCLFVEHWGLLGSQDSSPLSDVVFYKYLLSICGFFFFFNFLSDISFPFVDHPFWGVPPGIYLTDRFLLQRLKHINWPGKWRRG